MTENEQIIINKRIKEVKRMLFMATDESSRLTIPRSFDLRNALIDLNSQLLLYFPGYQVKENDWSGFLKMIKDIQKVIDEYEDLLVWYRVKISFGIHQIICLLQSCIKLLSFGGAEKGKDKRVFNKNAQ